jgi:TolB-like protein/DNA-binding winged helix-turn-helix (wHTH) protein
VSISVVKFAEFELDRGRYELRRGDCVLKLEKIPMELLVLLVESNGQLVTRDEIVERIWGKDVFLDTEHGINTAIRKIRQTLGDDPDSPRFVQTVTGKGYRFIATTATISSVHGNGSQGAPSPELADVASDLRRERFDGASAERALPDIATSIEPNSSSRTRFRTASLVLLGVIAILATFVGLNVRGTRDRMFSRAARPKIHSLAVLPLENLTGDPAQEYLADGMTDEVITMLAKNPSLRVISRTSVMQYKKVHRPLREIAQELGVDGILEGSVARSGNRLHVTAQLIHAPSDTHVWAESYDRDLSDVFSLPAELSQTIAKEVKTAVSPSIVPPRHINPEAHDAYLRGRYFWFAGNDKASQEYFEKAIQLQPNYAAAWSGLADTYVIRAAGLACSPQEVMGKAEAASRKSIELDDSLAEAHNTMAAWYFFFGWDLNRAEGEAARAVTLNPNLAEARHLHAHTLAALGRTEEAVEEQKRASEIDPFARPSAMGYAYIHVRQFDAAIADLRLRAQAVPGDVLVHERLSDAYRFKGMTNESARELTEAVRLRIGEKAAGAVRQAYKRGGERAMDEWLLKNDITWARQEYVSPWLLAGRYARLGRKEETLKFLEAAYREHSPMLVWLQNEPIFDFLHSDEQYRALVKKIGLPLAFVALREQRWSSG